MMLKRIVPALAALVLAFSLAASTELVVSAEVVKQPNGFALKIGEELVPLKSYELPFCLVTAKEPVKLAVKLEGDPPRVVGVVVVEGPCPAGTELPATVRVRFQAMLQKGYLNAKGEIVRKQDRWVLRIGDTEIPLEAKMLPPCLLESGAEVEVAALEGDEGELTLAKDGCVAQVRVEAKLRERIRETLRQEMRKEKGTGPKGVKNSVMETKQTMKTKAEEVKEGVQDAVEDQLEEVKDTVENVLPTPTVPNVPGSN